MILICESFLGYQGLNSSLWTWEARFRDGTQRSDKNENGESTKKIPSTEMIDSLWEFLRSGTNPKEEPDNVMSPNVEVGDDDIQVYVEECTDTNLSEINDDNNPKSASKFAKDFLKILQDTVNFKYAKCEMAANNENDMEDVEMLQSDIDFSNASQNYAQIGEDKNDNGKVFESKLLNLFDFLFDVVKSPKSDVLSRVRRKSSCFWSEQSPSDFGSREETIELSTKDEAAGTSITSNEKMETYIEFLSDPGCNPHEDSQSKKEAFKSPTVKIQRKSFRKKSSGNEDKLSILEYLLGSERKKSDSSIKKGRSSIDSAVIKPDGDQIKNDDEECIVLNAEQNACSILKKFSQESSELYFIDESPEVPKSKENLVDFILKCMDSLETANNPISRKNSKRKEDSDSKNNMLLETNIAIAKPDDFNLSPEKEGDKMMELTRFPRHFKDMGTSCDIPDSAGTSSLNSRLSPNEDGDAWIKPEQLVELRRCAEIIFKEVNRDTVKIAGVSVDLCEKSNLPEVKMAEGSVGEGTNPKIEKVSIALETSFDYDPAMESLDPPSEISQTTVSQENVHNYHYRVELEMIKESFEIDDYDSS